MKREEDKSIKGYKDVQGIREGEKGWMKSIKPNLKKLNDESDSEMTQRVMKDAVL